MEPARDKTPAEIESASMPNDIRAVREIRSILEPFSPQDRNAILDFLRQTNKPVNYVVFGGGGGGGYAHK